MNVSIHRRDAEGAGWLEMCFARGGCAEKNYEPSLRPLCVLCVSAVNHFVTMETVMSEPRNQDSYQMPDARGHFGPYGGQFVPETLIHPLAELVAASDEARRDPQLHP